MQDTDVGVHAGRFYGRSTVMGKECIGKGKQCIHSIERRPFISAMKIEVLLVILNERIKKRKVGHGSISFYSAQMIQRICFDSLPSRVLQILNDGLKRSRID